MRTTKKIAVRLVILVLFILCLNRATRFAYESIESTTPFAMQDAWKSRGTVDTVIVGTSLIHLGVDPEVLDEELACVSYNAASSSQAISSSYYLIKDQILNNPVKRVFLGIGVVGMNLEREPSELIASRLGAYDRIMSPFIRAEYILDIVEFPYYEKFLFYPTRISYFDDLKLAAKNIAYKSSDEYKQGMNAEGSEFMNRGMGFAGTDVSLLTSGNNIKMPANSVWDRNEILGENLEYLYKIGELCSKKGIELNLVLMPHAEKYAYIQGDLADMDLYFHELCEEIGADLYSFNYTSYDNIYEWLPDECFYDSKHMNFQGADIFTRLLAEEYKKRH